ncbi:hypothetical protein ABZY06_33885 [Streptomyces sp. NPDC006540]|uniref:deoxynucleotide monophosphate kinase family protein n=1 Tax=Streptomyces sp. NPDC006540 TaxID=3155353 RepID=UPI0033BAFF07
MAELTLKDIRRVNPLPNIALIGKARSGKDTIAQRLITTRQYTRVAFADPLKELALSVGPVVDNGNAGYQFQFARLSEVVNAVGWERAKDEYPEVRRFLQALGQSVRELDESFWLNIASRKIATAAGWNLPVVVTDVRYRNEADALRAAGFKMVRVLRKGVPDVGGAHASETELDDYPTDALVCNFGSLDALYQRVDALTA